ncbi:MAG: sigma factor-like helix-turn-helix DNA-binding protein, partial [Planctomycetota bacterium]
MERELQESAKEPLDRVLLRTLALLAPQHKEGLAMRLGWDGHGGCTLRKAADFLGISRERVRQIQRGLEGMTSSVQDFPVLDGAIRRLERVAEKLEDDPDRILCEEGITSIPFHPQGVLSAARMFGRGCRLEMQDGGKWVAFRDDPRFRPLSEFLARLPGRNHVFSMAEIMARLGETGAGLTADLVRSYLQSRKGLVRLDKAGDWFWDGRSTLHLNLARKLLSLRSPMDLDKLCAGVMRSHRSRRHPLPSPVLAGLFRAAGLAHQGQLVAPAFPRLHPHAPVGGVQFARLRRRPGLPRPARPATIRAGRHDGRGG